MANPYRTKFLLSLTAGVLLCGVTLAQAQNCTTRYNEILRRAETRCDNGVSATTRYNDILQRSETTINGPSGQQQRCVQRYNAILQRVETRCD